MARLSKLAAPGPTACIGGRSGGSRTCLSRRKKSLRRGKITHGGAAMPIHDWARVTAGTWHDFHLGWIAEIRNALNGGLLPPDYYAQAEQIAGPLGPDVLTLQEMDAPPNGTPSHPASGGRAGGGAPPPAPRP